MYGQYILDTDVSNFGYGGVLSQIQGELVVAYCSRALRPSQRRYYTTKQEMLAAVAMCIQFRSYLRGAKFIIRTDDNSLVWLYRFKDTEGLMAQWLHALQQFQLSIVHQPGRDHGNADGLSRAPSSPCRQCTRPDCPPVVEIPECADQPFTLSPPVGPKMLIWCLCIRGRTGSRCLMMIYLNHRLSRVIGFAYPLYKRRTQSATHCRHRFRQELFHPGRRLNACVRSCGGCGTIVVT